MDIITYSLKQSQPDSEMYYFGIAAFTDKVLLKGKKLFQTTVELYQAEFLRGNPAYFEEGLLELLIMGVYWRVYGGAASLLKEKPGRMLAAVSELRGSSGRFKPVVDSLKGIFSTIFLYNKAPEDLPELKYDVNNLVLLTAWLEAAGEFKQEVKRLNKWRDYLRLLPESEARRIIFTAASFAGWFEKQSEKHLDAYTPKVEHFLEERLPSRRWHEDVIFCGRRRVEYHLNMVGAEIMNRIYHNDFANAKEKVLLLPTCMRSPEKGKCCSRPQGRGFICTGCSKNCSVNRLTGFGQQKDLQVKMVPHESSIAATKTDESLFGAGSGVIGVSCVLNLISGGWMLADKGTYPQCVILDYCGCKKHWHPQGISTGINEKQLMRILESKINQK